MSIKKGVENEKKKKKIWLTHSKLCVCNAEENSCCFGHTFIVHSTVIRPFFASVLISTETTIISLIKISQSLSG